MIDSGHLKPESDVLDVGCGLGRVARVLTEFLTTGSYHGFDVVESSIAWCRENYKAKNFTFIHADLASSYYNASATARPEDYRFPFTDASFDFVFSLSVFTHMPFAGVDNYLGEMARTLRPGGIAWNSFFLLDEASERYVRTPKKKGINATVPIEGGLTADPDSPDKLTLYHLDRVREAHERHGLQIIQCRQAGWDGRYGQPILGQDRIVARRMKE